MTFHTNAQSNTISVPFKFIQNQNQTTILFPNPFLNDLPPYSTVKWNRNIQIINSTLYEGVGPNCFLYPNDELRTPNLTRLLASGASYEWPPDDPFVGIDVWETLDICRWPIFQKPVSRNENITFASTLVSRNCSIFGIITITVTPVPTLVSLPFSQEIKGRESLYLTMKGPIDNLLKINITSQDGDVLADNFDYFSAAPGDPSCPTYYIIDDPNHISPEIPYSTQLQVTLPYRELWYALLFGLPGSDPSKTFVVSVNSVPPVPPVPPVPGQNIWIIVGAVLGAVFGVVILIVGMVWFCKRQNGYTPVR